MARQSSSSDLFSSSRARPQDYPLNVNRTETFGHVLELYHNKLKATDLFHPTSRNVFLLDLAADGKVFQPSSNLSSVVDLAGYLDESKSDPRWRFAFFQSPMSRDPLGCTIEQMALLLTHYQVMPSFLDFVFTFRARLRPVDHAAFRQENYLEQDSPAFALPTLGRSGYRIQHAFNLLSVERSESRDEGNPWPLRQTVLYHSFDVQNGNSQWIILKGNRLMRRRIAKACTEHRHLQPSSMSTPAGSFVATLQVHLLLMEWCAENWTEYIDYMDEKVSRNSVVAKIAPVAEVTSPRPLAQSFSRKGTMQTTGSRQSTFNRSQSNTIPTPPTIQQPRTLARSFSDLLRRASGLGTKRWGDTPNNIMELAQAAETAGADLLAELESTFSFDKFQMLNLVGDELEESLFVIEQNKGVLGEIREQYQTVMASHAFTSLMKTDEIQGEVSNFFRRIRSIERDLDIHYCRLKALCRTLENDKTMFEAIIQYMSAKTSTYFARSAHVSSQRMEDWTKKMHRIAVKTEQETVSMHVITVFTLVFLPGTFLAVRYALPYLVTLAHGALTTSQTFFSSGVLHWDDNDTLGSDWVVRSDGMRLFMSICLPMMSIILAAWALTYYLARRTRKRRAAAVEGLVGETDIKLDQVGGLNIV